ncbi:MAG: hypothetical protein JO019_01900 [Candidatus Kaiserbacteria bacterium]|nr:hypothetical protein [Candidatus Kaiserbacteria bacterium]
MNTTRIITAGTVAAALLTATPALADDHGQDNNHGLNFGAKISVMAHEKDHAATTSFGKIVSQLAHSMNGKHDGKDKDHATSTVSDKSVINGTVTALNGATLTVTGTNGTVYTVNAANASVNGDTNTAIALAGIQSGDRIEVKGTLNGSVITATKINDKSLLERNVIQKLNNVRIGVISSVTGGGFNLSGLFGAGSTTVTTNASTTYKVKGQATTSTALANGQLVVVQGTQANGSFAASLVRIVNVGANFFEHLFNL